MRGISLGHLKRSCKYRCKIHSTFLESPSRLETALSRDFHFGTLAAKCYAPEWPPLLSCFSSWRLPAPEEQTCLAKAITEHSIIREQIVELRIDLRQSADMLAPVLSYSCYIRPFRTISSLRPRGTLRHGWMGHVGNGEGVVFNLKQHGYVYWWTFRILGRKDRGFVL